MNVTRHVAPALLFAFLMCAPAAPLGAQEDASPPEKKIRSCNDDPGFQEMDFWLGEWDVVFGTRVVGTSRIRKALKGCAITEDWTADDGSEARGLFYFNAATRTWRQVWVTTAAYSPGGLKEQTLVERMKGGGLRFQGEQERPGGTPVFERTTLVPNFDGTVRQWIQISTDGGEMWTSVFDAVYVRKGRGGN